MEQEKRSIPTYNLDSIDEAEITYYLYGEVDYYSIGGQGDVEHNWVFFCKNKDNKPVLITGSYDVSWWSPGGPGPSNISRNCPNDITEEVLSDEEAMPYFTRFEGTAPKKVVLPI